MKRLVPFEVEGHLIYVEVEEVESSSQAPVFRSGGQDVVESETASRFVDAIETVKPAAEVVLNTLRNIANPDELGLEFGIKLNAKVGAFLASADSEATFKVTLKWTNRRGDTR